LELGAGFNPALTGRENVYIQGALMGFSHSEMEGKIAPIEEFADIGQFFDQPVKFYSSGMFLRLAFAAAINVDPDVLIVDEAISVGDAKFQHKCYLKLREFQQKGVTIIFVSHDMSAVTRVCDHLVLMDRGVLIKEGAPDEVVNLYLELLLADGRTVPSDAPVTKSEAVQENSTSMSDVEAFLYQSEAVQPLTSTRASYNKGEVRAGDKRAEIIDYLIVNESGGDTGIITSGDTVTLYIKAHFYQYITTPVYGISIKTLDGTVIYATNTRIKQIPVRPANAADTHIFSFSMRLPLRQGDYFMDVGLTEAIQQGTDEALLDVRYSLAHLSITSPKELFDGLVELEVKTEEILISCRDY
jgi:lipopolysaccharide transport system ATP-binding protein